MEITYWYWLHNDEFEITKMEKILAFAQEIKWEKINDVSGEDLLSNLELVQLTVCVRMREM